LGDKYLPIPTEWQRCDGSKIWSGSMRGGNTPKLNADGYFLRGAQTTDAWTIQEDMIRQHGHNIHDPGHKHTHSDSGHTHTYYDRFDTGYSRHAMGSVQARDNDADVIDRDSGSSSSNIDIHGAHTNIKAQDITGTNAKTAQEHRRGVDHQNFVIYKTSLLYSISFNLKYNTAFTEFIL
jgi:hypothetical protein